MRLLTLLVVLSNVFSSVICEKCDLNKIGVVAYKERKWVHKTENGPYLNITDLTRDAKIVVILQQNIPILCKKLPDRLEYSEIIFLAHDRIATIEKNAFGGMKNLSSLDLSWNNLKRIKSGVFNNLQSLVLLDLSKNQIASMEPTAFDNMPELKHVNISGNRLTAISNRWFTNCPKLQGLILSNNLITQVPYLAFLSLNSDLEISIDLSVNRIERIAIGAFANIVKFGKLQLQRNKIKEVPEFSELQSGRLLNLKSNRVECFSKNVAKTLSRFDKVRVKGNTFNSNCTYDYKLDTDLNTNIDWN